MEKWKPLRASHFSTPRRRRLSELRNSCATLTLHSAQKIGHANLDFIRPGRPVENGYIESLNGRLPDECLNVEVFFSLADARRKLAIWLDDYKHDRSHSALADRTPAEFAAICSDGNDGDKTALKNAAPFPHFSRTTMTSGDLTYAMVSSLLLATIT